MFFIKQKELKGKKIISLVILSRKQENKLYSYEVITDSDGNHYFSNLQNHAITKFDITGQLTNIVEDKEKSILKATMFTFFKISVYTAVVALFMLGLITISDIFIHSNQLQFYILTVITAMLFFAIGFTGIIIYKNFKNIYHYISQDNEQSPAEISVRRLLLLFGLIAIAITLFIGLLCMGLLERMNDGTALFG